MKSSDKTFKEGSAALETLLDGEFRRIFGETIHQGCEEVAGAPITEKHSVSWSNLTNWADRLSVLIEEAFEKYTALAVANSQFVEGEPIEWIEARVRQFLEPRLGHEMKVAHPDPKGTSELSFAERVTGGQKAHKLITYWVAEVSEGEGQDLGYSVGDGDWEFDDEAVDSWQAPAWLAHGFLQKETLDGRLDAKTTALEVGVIHFELWKTLEEAIGRGGLAAKVEIAASTSPELEQLEIEQNKPGGKKGKEPIARFPPLPDLRWEEVSMAFISDTEIKVRARDQIKKYRFDHIGFKNKKSDKPNILWWFLRALAEKGGELSWDNSGSYESPLNPNQVQSNVKRLRKTLCKFMDIEDDPFYPYREVKAYKAKFTISGNVDTLLEPDNDGSESDLQSVYEEEINKSR